MSAPLLARRARALDDGGGDTPRVSFQPPPPDQVWPVEEVPADALSLGWARAADADADRPQAQWNPPPPDQVWSVEEVPADAASLGWARAADADSPRVQWNDAPADQVWTVEEVSDADASLAYSRAADADGDSPRVQWSAPPADQVWPVEEVTDVASALADEPAAAAPSTPPTAAPSTPAPSTPATPPTAAPSSSAPSTPSTWAPSTPSTPAPSIAPSSGPTPSAEAPTPPAASAPFVQPVVADAPDHLKEPDYSDELPELPESLAGELPPALTLQEMYRIVRAVAVSDSADGLYSAVCTNADYAGSAAAYGGRRFGLAFGLLLFTQESGRLGSVLRLAERRSPQAFDEAFGPAARELLAVTGSGTVAGRMGLVGGRPLDDAEWIARFRAAGAREEIRNAQNEEAIAHLLRPLVPWAMALGLDTDRGLAFALDRAVTRGLGGGVRWMMDAAGLLRSPADVEAALRHLGYGELRDFQASTRWLAPTGQADAATVAGLLARLRRHGGYPLPAAPEVQQRLLAAAAGPARRRLERLAHAEALHDTPFQLG